MKSLEYKTRRAVRFLARYKVLQIVISTALYALVYYSVSDETFEREIFQVLGFISADSKAIWFLLVATALMPLNWLLESFKWQQASSPVEELTLPRAIKGVLVGMAFSFFTPNRIGEYLGRILSYRTGDRWKGVVASVVCSLAQITVIFVAGAVAFIFYLNNSQIFEYQVFENVLKFFLLMYSILVVAFFFLSNKIPDDLIYKLPRGLQTRLSLLSEYSKHNLADLFSLSLLRYVIFTSQFVLVLWAFNVNLTWAEMYVLVPIVFVLQTIIPSIALAEMGIRESVAIAVFAMVTDQLVAVGLASFTLWIINLLTPTIAGGLLLFQMKFFRNTKATKPKMAQAKVNA